MLTVLEDYGSHEGKGIDPQSVPRIPKSVETDNGGGVYILEGRQLTQGQMQRRFYDSWCVIRMLMVSKTHFVPELDN